MCGVGMVGNGSDGAKGGQCGGIYCARQLAKPSHLTHPDLWAGHPIVQRLDSSAPICCRTSCERIEIEFLSADAMVYDLHVWMYKMACLQDQQGRPQVEGTGEHAAHRPLTIARLVSSCYTANPRCIIVRRFHIVHPVVAKARPSSGRISISWAVETDHTRAVQSELYPYQPHNPSQV
jgi:hypothetical protein